MRNVILDQLRSDFGSNDLNALYDHIMVCMPHGTLSKSGKHCIISVFSLKTSMAAIRF